MTLEELVNSNSGLTTTKNKKNPQEGKTNKQLTTETKQPWLEWQLSSESDSESNTEKNSQ